MEKNSCTFLCEVAGTAFLVLPEDFVSESCSRDDSATLGVGDEGTAGSEAEADDEATIAD